MDETSVSAYCPRRPRSRQIQIRIHLTELEMSIVGDTAYGSRRNLTGGFSKEETLHLHAWQLSLAHPMTREPIHFTAAPPPWAQRGLGDDSATP